MVCHRILMYFMFDIIGIFKFIALFLGGGNGNPMALQLENEQVAHGGTTAYKMTSAQRATLELQ